MQGEPSTGGNGCAAVPGGDVVVAMTTTGTGSSAPIGGKSDAATVTCNVGVMTDPDCLGPCEPGTSIVLEGIVWSESNNGKCIAVRSVNCMTSRLNAL